MSSSAWIGIFSGFVVLLGLLSAHRLAGWTALFSCPPTVLTSATGFLFHIALRGPRMSSASYRLIVPGGFALFALYGSHLASAWRWIYVVSALVALYSEMSSSESRRLSQKLSFPGSRWAPTQSEARLSSSRRWWWMGDLRRASGFLFDTGPFHPRGPRPPP